MSDHRPPPRSNGFARVTAGQKVVTIVTMLAVAAGGLLFARWAARPEDTRPAAGAAVTLPRTGTAATVAAGGDGRTVAYQTRLTASVQAMLDTVVGPGHSVATTTAELDLDDVGSTTRTYTSDPKVAALAESISHQAWRGTETGMNWYENRRVVRTNAVNLVVETRRRAPGTVTRLSVAVLLDATTAAAVDPARVEQMVRAAVGFTAARGDTTAVVALPFDPSVADQAQQTIAAAAAATAAADRARLMKLAVVGAIVLLLGFLAWRTVRRPRQRTGPVALTGPAALDQRRPAELGTAIPQPGPELGRAVDPRRQRALEQLVRDRPKEVTALVRELTGR